MPSPCLRALACVGLAALVAACSSGGPRLSEAQERERYASYAQATGRELHVARALLQLADPG